MGGLGETKDIKVPKKASTKGALGLGSIAGIEIQIHFTWILAFIFITWSLAAGFFPQEYPDWQQSIYWIIGASAALLLFFSVLVHELAHSIVARSRGMPVNSIVLFIFGGASQIEEEPEEPRDEFLMALVGPVTSLALAGIFYGMQLLIAAQDSPFGAILGYMALINALLGGFNLLPGLPLDGGRLLRSAVNHFTGNLQKATRIAAGAGKVLAWSLIAIGFFILLSGNLLGGLWIAFIGWFLNNAASQSGREATLREQLTGVQVKEVMRDTPCIIHPDTDVDKVVNEIFLHGGVRAAPVCVDEKPVGIVTPSDVKELPRDHWQDKSVEQIMTKEPLHTVDVSDDLKAAFKKLAQNDINQLLVLQEGKVVGIIGRSDIIRYIQLAQELNLNESGNQSGPTSVTPGFRA